MAADAKRIGLSPAVIRCAIYCRKSTEEGLDQNFNTLEAQHDACTAWILSQKEAGWTAVRQRYDDGGYSGATLDRPAFKRLRLDIQTGTIDAVVLYRVDRLTRSIRDLMEILTLFEEHNVTLASVTESFNTATPAGRLTLHLLLTFAQYERELIAERTRDKMHAARRKGKWVGGFPPLGYDVVAGGGAIVINPSEAERVREIFDLYLKFGSLIPVIEELQRRDSRMKAWITQEGKRCGGSHFNKTTLHKLLTNLVYVGRLKFQGQVYQGEHAGIVSDDIFNRVQAQLTRNGGRTARRVGNRLAALLKGLVVCGSCGAGMIATYVRKKNKLYRYYVCRTAHQRGWNQCATRSVSASDLEAAVIQNLRNYARDPLALSGVLQQLSDTRETANPVADPKDVADALSQFDPLWNELSTWERERCIRALVARVQYDGTTQTVTVGFHNDIAKNLCGSDGATK